MATAKAATAKTLESGNENVSADEIEQNVDRIRGDIATLAQSITQYGAGKTGEYKERANKATQDLAKMSQETLDNLSAELSRMEKALTTRVREKPLQSLGIAAGVGILVAMLARRR